ncbi:MAG: MBL fold metallo-hydrolase [Actinobacteria bacterium]|nr:MAG: MBL fold metallo-hydrolase [Actinomycetota bacterium]
MLVERSMHPEWLSNSYLVADEPGGRAVIIDSGAPAEPLLDAIERHEVTPEQLLLTHHQLEAERLLDVDTAFEPGEVLEVGGLRIDAIHTPGHTAGMLAFRVNDSEVFTGDTLFKGSVGGVRAPGSTTFEDLRSSVMDVLMKLPPQTVVRPGHTDPTTIGEEWEGNAFVRLWRGLDEESHERCRVGEEEAVLVLFAPDYDGGHKAWVRWTASGRDDIVPGSAVERY